MTGPGALSGCLEDGTSLYLDLLKKVLTRYIAGTGYQRVGLGGRKGRALAPIRPLLDRAGLEIVRRVPVDAQDRAEGRDWPVDAETMVGLKRLDNIEYCVRDVLDRDVPGDLIETGVWRGGSVIFMRAVLKAHGCTSRTVWAADSFRGLPEPEGDVCPEDTEDALWTHDVLAVSIEEVKANFARYGMLDDQVRFLPGWFKESLPASPVDRISVLRLDGDMYDSTMTALESLYPRLSAGGYVIVDDYLSVHGCRKAVDEFRAGHGITDALRTVDWTCVFWQRSD